MKSFKLRVNISHLKDNIENNYFLYKDIFYRILIFNVIEFSRTQIRVTNNFLIDDISYNGLYISLYETNSHLIDVMSKLNDVKDLNIMLDLNEYILEFLNKKYDNRAMNIVNLEISTPNELVITMKQFKLPRDNC